MADITDPEVVRFLGEEIRPLAERLRDLDAKITSVLVRWNTIISPAISANVNGDLIEDGRAAQGISRVTKADLVNLVTILNNINAEFGGGGKRDVLDKPTVRALDV